jgi:predicted phage replisome organizer
MAGEKKYYWLKLQRDFFKRHDIRIIEEMENGKDYLLFYLKLLVESIDHNGNLRFSDTVPYNEKMLSVVTNTNLDIVRSALKVFTELKMIEVLQDETIYMTEVEKMIGSAADNDNAKRQQRYRDNKKAEIAALEGGALRKVTWCVTNNNESKSKNKSKSIEIEKDIDNTSKEVRHKHGEYGHVLLTEKQYRKLSDDYGEEATKLAIKKVDEYCQQYGKRYTDYNLTLRKWGYDGIKTKKTSGNSDLDEWAARKEREQNERK